MWPMSNALYPGLKDPAEQQRPGTSDTNASWFTYGTRRYSASNYSRKAWSTRRSARTGRTGETEGGEDLRDLLRQSQKALTNLRGNEEADIGTQGFPDADSDVIPFNDPSWKKPLWRSLSKRTNATGATSVSVVTGESSQAPSAEPAVASSSDHHHRRRSSSRHPPPARTVRSKRIPSVASRMDPDDPEPDPVPAYQEVEVGRAVLPTLATKSYAPTQRYSTVNSGLRNDFESSLSRLDLISSPSISTMSFTGMGNNGAGISFAKVDYDAQDEAAHHAQDSTSPQAVTFSNNPFSNNPFHARANEREPVSPLSPNRNSMYRNSYRNSGAFGQPRVVTFSNFDEVAITSSADSRSMTAPTVDTWDRLEGASEKQPSSSSATEEGGDDLPPPPTTSYLYGLPLAAVIFALSLAVFLVAMDVNVIATAVPHITAEFSSLDDVGWYGSAFLMTTCAFQVLFGRIYTIFPAKLTFLGAIGIFMIGSVLAAVAPNSTVFIVGRAVQGMGTSGILSGGLIIISQVVPLQMRSILGGVIGAMEGVAMISAPIIGGTLTDKLNWRWCFYINLPIGGFVLVAVFFFLRIPEQNRPQQAVKRTWTQTARDLDLIGAALIMPPIVCILLALQYGGSKYAWDDMGIILLFVLGFVLFLVFAYSQHVNADVAMVPFRIIKQRSILAGFWYILCTASALVVMTYFSGLRLLPVLIGVIVSVLLSGALVSGLGYYTPFMILGSILMSVGIGLMSSIYPDTSNTLLIIFPAIFGAGVGIGFQQPLIGAQAVLPKEDIPIGTSIIVFGQTIGSAIVLSVGESVFQNQLKNNIESYLGIVVKDAHSLMTEGTAQIEATLTPDQLPALRDAVSKSLTQTFYVALAMAGLSIIGSLAMEWKSVKKIAKEQEAEAAAEAATTAESQGKSQGEKTV
ncbi:hypothetical protein G7054_g3645 [Neopestalotiopsis clavispora]|nr:hypothetical protein G7054_g3645 [Neopestalotiopsis clavispora]